MSGVVGLEAPHELHRGAGERVDILVIISDRKQAELVLCVGARSPRKRREERVLLGVDVLVLVDQYPPKTPEQPVSEVVPFFGFHPFSIEQRSGLFQHTLEVGCLNPVDTPREARPCEPHGERMAGEDPRPRGRRRQ